MAKRRQRGPVLAIVSLLIAGLLVFLKDLNLSLKALQLELRERGGEVGNR